MSHSPRNQNQTLKFIVIGIFFMILADRFLLPEGTAFHELWNKPAQVVEIAHEETGQPDWYEENIPAPEPEDDAQDNIVLEPYGPFQRPIALPDIFDECLPPVEPVDAPVKEPEKDVPLWRKNAVPFDVAPNKPKIAIVIDDLGPAHKQTEEIIALPSPLTLAFLPYAKDLPDKTGQAKAQGHEILIHMPMKPLSDKVNSGPLTLQAGMSAEKMEAYLETAFKAVDGSAGMNNHMGSSFTKEDKAVDMFMDILSKKGMFFLDSRTTSETVCEIAADKHSVPFVSRDVFLDHKNEKEFIENALKEVERIAKKHGQVIAIGHPHTLTIKALEKWIPEVKARGFQLVPLSVLVKEKVQNNSALH